MSKCTKCNRRATYVSPELFCDEHWLRWWNEGVYGDPDRGDILDGHEDEGCPIRLQRLDDHIDSCDLCGELLLDEGEYCVIGQSLEEDWGETLEDD